MGDRLHGDLHQGLRVNGYQYMTEIQAQATKNGLLEGENLILTAETGSGKTLTYLMPIMNQLFHYKDKRPNLKKPKFHLTKANEDSMFLNAEEIHYKAQ